MRSKGDINLFFLFINSFHVTKISDGVGFLLHFTPGPGAGETTDSRQHTIPCFIYSFLLLFIFHLFSSNRICLWLGVFFYSAYTS